MFKFDLSQQVKVTISGEVGTVKGRAEFTTSENQYLLHMKAADGRAADIWFDGTDIKAVDNQK